MENIIEFFAKNKNIFVIAHVFSVIVGMGSAMASDLLFNSFIKDFKINKTENRTLGLLSDIIWGALAVVVLSGIALLLSDPAQYASSVKFLVKMTVVGCIIINGYMFQRLVHPTLKKFNFADTNYEHKYVRVRRLSFTFGAISVISWLFAFILGMSKTIPVTYWQAIFIYLAVCTVGVVASQHFERRVANRAKHHFAKKKR